MKISTEKGTQPNNRSAADSVSQKKAISNSMLLQVPQASKGTAKQLPAQSINQLFSIAGKSEVFTGNAKEEVSQFMHETGRDQPGPLIQLKAFQKPSGNTGGKGTETAQKRSMHQLVKRQSKHNEPVNSGSGTIQLMMMYRVQNDDNEKKRMVIDKGGGIKLGPGPLNVSAGYPDHALYFLGKGNAYETDVVEFEIDDGVYYHIVSNMTTQSGRKGKDKERPSFNDISKPGFKIEIPSGPFLEAFGKGLVQGTGKVTRGAEFVQREAPRMYNEKEVCAMAKATQETYPKIEKQVIKLMSKYEIEFNGDSFSCQDPGSVNWQEVNDELWVLFNKEVNKNLK